jgi:hypothetical protein
LNWFRIGSNGGLQNYRWRTSELPVFNRRFLLSENLLLPKSTKNRGDGIAIELSTAYREAPKTNILDKNVYIQKNNSLLEQTVHTSREKEKGDRA